jgi:hypothetical protein
MEDLMNKVLNTLVMLSVMTAVVPAQAVRTRGQQRAIDRVALVRVPEVRDVVADEVRDAEVVADEQEVQNQQINRNALIAAAVAAGAIATAVYCYATTVDCGAVAQAYCAGAQIAPAALQACQQYLPSTIGCWF